MTQELVYIVDDDEAVLDSLSIMLGTMGYLTSPHNSALKFLENYTLDNQGCLLLDLRMPKMTGLELLEKLRQMHSTLPVIIITAYGDVPSAVKAMQLGAIDFLEKPYREEVIVEKVNYALKLNRDNGEDTSVIQLFQERFKQLTSRELEVYRELVSGLQNKVIARKLDISPRTVEIHRAHVMEKLQVTGIAELVRLSIRSGLT